MQKYLILPYKGPSIPIGLTEPLFVSLFKTDSEIAYKQMHRMKVQRISKGGSEYIFSDDKVGLAVGVKGSKYNSGADIVRKVRQFGFTNIVLVKSEFDVKETSEVISGLVQANYRYKQLGIQSQKQKEDDEQQGIFNLISHIHVPEDLYQEPQFQEAIKLASYKLYARDLANSRTSPEYFIQEVRELAENNKKIQIKFIEGEDLKHQNLNLFYGVGKGSIHKPVLINLTYKGNNDSDKLIALVGKGITFDTGGLHLKGYGNMEKMYLDKSGACNVLATFKAAVEMNLKINITATLGFAENAISNTAYKPGDIIRSLSGLTVEINNTDAEGRLVLADCLTWTQNLYKPSTIIETSTLTGACAAALGDNTGGLMSNDKKLANEIVELGDQLQEPFCQLPVTQEHFDMMKGDFSDLCNVGKGKVCGAQKAAAFLMNFVEKNTPYAHLDIAGPMESKADKNTNPLGATGFGTQNSERIKTMKVLCIGDSYSLFEGELYWNSYPMLLQQKLRKEDPQSSVEILAQSGFTTGEMLEIIRSYIFQESYDRVYVLIGVNNQYRGQSQDIYEQEFTEIIQIANRLSQDVVVISIPDWSYTPFAQEKRTEEERIQITQQITQFNRINQKLAPGKYIDISRLFSIAQQEDYAKDGLHYSKQMHQKWVDML